MSFDLFLVRPKDPSAAPVEQMNPFTGEATSVAPTLSLDPEAFAALASRLAPLGFAPDGDGLLMEIPGCRFEVTPDDGSAELWSDLEDDGFARVLRAVELTAAARYRVVGGGVDSDEAEPVADQLIQAFDRHSEYVDQALKRLRGGSA